MLGDSASRENAFYGQRCLVILSAILTLLALVATPGLAEEEPALSGMVSANGKPEEAVRVFVYEVATEELREVLTNVQGHYSLSELPTGFFKVIAFKRGFLPAVEILLRRSGAGHQTLPLELQDAPRDDQSADDYWSLRAQIPPDILRQVPTLGLGDGTEGIYDQPVTVTAGAPEGGPTLDAMVAPSRRIRTRMNALRGIEQLGADLGSLQWSGAELGIQGELGALSVGVNGRFRELNGAGNTGSAPTADARGQAHSIDVRVVGSEDQLVSFRTQGGEMEGMQGEGRAPVDHQSHQVQWAGRTGDGHSAVTAAYTTANNFYRMGGGLQPVEIPGSTRTLRLAGTHDRDLTGRTALVTGIVYQQRSTDVVAGTEYGDADRLSEERIDLYGLAETQVRPWLAVEYGLHSQVLGGAVSLMPQASLRVALAGDWQAEASFASRMDEGGGQRLGLADVLFSDSGHCSEMGQSCYGLFLSREGGEGELIRVGAVQREYAETLRLYFDDDFFNRMESLFLVPGDELNELQLQLVRRLSPGVLSTLRSHLAEGGGGVFQATSEDSVYENEVRYLVTSVDTQFQNTDTGVFLAFHHLRQALRNPARSLEEALDLEIQRLQLMLTQDLGILSKVAANWQVRLNFELSRGANPYVQAATDELRRKLTGGFSVAF